MEKHKLKKTYFQMVQSKKNRKVHLTKELGPSVTVAEVQAQQQTDHAKAVAGAATVDIWERNRELIRKRTDIGEHFTREVIQSIVFIFLPLGERVHLTNPVYYY